MKKQTSYGFLLGITPWYFLPSFWLFFVCMYSLYLPQNRLFLVLLTLFLIMCAAMAYLIGWAMAREAVRADWPKREIILPGARRTLGFEEIECILLSPPPPAERFPHVHIITFGGERLRLGGFQWSDLFLVDISPYVPVRMENGFSYNYRLYAKFYRALMSGMALLFLFMSAASFIWPSLRAL